MDQPGGGDAVRNPSRRVSRRSEKWAVETRIATMNICGGLDGKIDEVCEVFNTRGMDLLCVNESKRKGRGITTHGTLTAYWSGVPESEHGCQGVGIVLSERWNNCVKEYECVSPRLIWIRLKVGLTRLFVLGVYAPDTSKSAQEIDEFWKSMNVVLDECDENERVIMLGDFNSWVGVQRDGYESVLGKFGDVRVNENGRYLLDVCLERNLIVSNSMFRHKEIHMYTWQRQNERSIIDFVIVDERLRVNVADTRVYRGVNVGTDHFLVERLVYETAA